MKQARFLKEARCCVVPEAGLQSGEVLTIRVRQADPRGFLLSTVVGDVREEFVGVQ